MKGSKENPQNKKEPSSSPHIQDHSGSSPTSTQAAGLESSPSMRITKIRPHMSFRKHVVDVTSNSNPSIKIRRIRSRISFRKKTVDLTLNAIEQPQRKADTVLELVRRFPEIKHLEPKTEARHPVPEPLIRKYGVARKRGFVAKGGELPPAIFSRPHIVVLQQLPPETTGTDIVQALEEAVETNRMPHWARRLANVRVEPTFGDRKLTAARIEFLHPDGAEAVRSLVRNGLLQVRGVMPTASLLRDKANSKFTNDTGIGIMASRQERENYFISPIQRKIVRRTQLIYN